MASNESKNDKEEARAEVLMLQQQQERADVDEQSVRNEFEELNSWTRDTRDTESIIDDNKLNENSQNKTESLKGKNVRKKSFTKEDGSAKKIKRNRKKRAKSESPIMATVWKYHEQDDNDDEEEEEEEGGGTGTTGTSSVDKTNENI